MASVTEMRRQNREVHENDPSLGKLGTRQYEYLQNSLRKSLKHDDEIKKNGSLKKKNII